jgi:light-regulated signal transduction histidine kinase (bacteriophytochrome)
LGIDSGTALGASLDALLEGEALHAIRNRMFGLQGSGGTERLYGISLVPSRPLFDVAVHYSGDKIILEAEPAGLDSQIDAASLVRTMVSRVSKHAGLEDFHRDAARQVRALTGFDRVMIYRFAADGAGEVIAEALTTGTDSFLGLHYPASDIPVQARALYLRNPFRIIADVHATDIPLLSKAGDALPLDLSLAITRAVSPVHIEYLRNMGVAASASISIIIDGALWGLIACHNYVPRLPTFVVRTAAELFGQMYSMTLESRLRHSEDREDRLGRDAAGRMFATIAANQTLLTHAGWLHDVIRQMIQCDGIAIYIAGLVSVNG